MNIIVIYPKTESYINELAQKTAKVHATYVFNYIQKLNCSEEKKKLMLKNIIENNT